MSPGLAVGLRTGLEMADATGRMPLRRMDEGLARWSGNLI